MADQSIIDEAVKYASGGIGLGAGGIASIAAVRWFVGWLTGRLDAKQRRIDAEDRELDKKWKEYREEIKARLDATEEKADKQGLEIAAQREEIDRCHAEKRELERRLARLEGFAAGRGEAAQLGQVEESFGAVLSHRLEGKRPD